MKYFPLIVLLALLAFSGCSNDTVTNGSSADLTAAYECSIGTTDNLSNFLTVNLKHTGSSLTGFVETYDTTNTHKGTLTGTFDGNNIVVTGDITGTQYDFTFNGTLVSQNPKKISGTLQFTTGDAKSYPVDFTETQAVDTAIPPNQYIFKTYYTSPAPTGAPVVFVHGMGGSIREFDSLLSKLPADFKARHNIYLYQYDWQRHIDTNGIILRDSVLARGLVNPILIGHSMGGLVVRAYVKNGGQITKLVTLGTPHLGSPLLKLKNFVPWLDLPGPQDISPNSEFLTALNNSPLDIASRSKYYFLAGRVGGSFSNGKWIWRQDYYSAFIKVAYFVMKLYYPNKDNDGLVSEDSAYLQGSGVNTPIPTQLWVDHMHEQYPVISSGMFNYICGL